MTYIEASKIITHKHKLAACLPEQLAKNYAIEFNWDKPESHRPFRAEACAECNFWHVRRGSYVYVKDLRC